MKKYLLAIFLSLTIVVQSQVLTVPVVVHVVYNVPVENISDIQVYSQISALNRDFGAMNDDTILIPPSLRDSITDTEIRFELVTMDPFGNPTNGITRTESDITEWSLFAAPFEGNYAEKIKSSATGGSDSWNPECILNIWVGDLGFSVLGYAQPPSGDIETDGVVINYSVFGNGIGTITPYDSGRTAVHEIGHWFGLIHTFSLDSLEFCFGEDPEPEAEELSFMHPASDNCSLMFLGTQKATMRNILLTTRASIGDCDYTTAIQNNQNGKLNIYPNPAEDFITLSGLSAQMQLQVFNISSELVLHQIADTELSLLHISSLNSGVYMIVLTDDKHQVISETFIKL